MNNVQVQYNPWYDPRPLVLSLPEVRGPQMSDDSVCDLFIGLFDT